MKIRKIASLVGILASVVLSGCAAQALTMAMQAAQGAAVRTSLERDANVQASRHVGTKIDPAYVSQIKNGETTRAQVEEIFGPPQRVFMTGDGNRMMLYSYYSASEKQTLQVVLDNSGVVKDYEFTR